MNGNGHTSHKQRLRAALAGEPLDRVPVALWGHDFHREWSPEGLADWTLESYRAYDWDLIKLNPRATYYFEAWGSSYEPTGTTQPRLKQSALQSIEQLGGLPTVAVQGGPFGEQLDALRRVVAAAGDDVDVIQTVFNPLTVAIGLLGMRPQAFAEQARGNPAPVHAGLSVIAHTLARYAQASVEAGASGIFFATVDCATREAVDEEFYQEFGRPYDLQVLAPVQAAPVNLLHVCRNHNMIDLLLDYPVRAVNWDDHGAGNPRLRDIQERVQSAVMGGVDRLTLRNGSAEDVRAQVRDAIEETGGRRFILAAGCAVAPDAPPENLRAVVEAVRGG